MLLEEFGAEIHARTVELTGEDRAVLDAQVADEASSPVSETGVRGLK